MRSYEGMADLTRIVMKPEQKRERVTFYGRDTELSRLARDCRAAGRRLLADEVAGVLQGHKKEETIGAVNG